MGNDRSSDEAILSASLLMKKGRFADALLLLQRDPRVTHIGTHPGRSLLADALQRTGNNREAERIASRYLKLSPAPPAASARCHFVIGNVCRERGDANGAIAHLQTASRLGEADLELSCWAQLRLMAAVAELAGGRTAMARLGEVRRCLTRFGDARPFAALHLWLAEIETTSGSLDSARRHLRIAHSLLAQIDDVWLQGYFAINSFGVSYYSAEISEAKQWADVAMECAALSGHAGGRRAAHANLGHIEFSLGRLSQAEKCFRLALEYSEHGSAHYFAILDSIAQIELTRGDLQACQLIVDQLERLSIQHSKANYCGAWALQTKLQLLLRQGRVVEAVDLCNTLNPLLETIAQPRVRAILGLLSVEALIANGDFGMAATRLGSVLSSSVELPPDLLAETERVIAKTLSLSGAPSIGRVSFERAIDTFDVIGHAIGKGCALSDFSDYESTSIHKVEAFSARCSLDRIRVLLETKQRPELFGLEAFRLLRDLDCTTSAALSTHGSSEQSSVLCELGPPDDPNSHALLSGQGIVVNMGSSNQRQFELTLCPKQDSASILASITFQRIIHKLLALRTDIPDISDTEPLCSSTEYLSHQEVVFAADSMVEILKTTNKIATTNLSVLITGETGTGKEIIARAIHDQSNRASKPFIALNCAAVPRELLESQLFGHRRGAFSGAHEQFEGVIRAARGGTLLLDEVGEMAIEMQPKLLRFLESGEVQPLGESRPIKVDVRLLFATNAGIEELVKQRRFREDLLFRINVIHIKVPPLRERREEIPLLVNLFAQRFSRELSKEIPKFATETIERLILYAWPGNVRQLSNEVRRLIAVTDRGTMITPDLLSVDTRQVPLGMASKATEAPRAMIGLEQTLSNAVDYVERTMLEHALNKTGGRVTVAAKMLGLSRKGLYLKRQRFGMLNLGDRSPSSVRAPHSRPGEPA